LQVINYARQQLTTANLFSSSNFLHSSSTVLCE